MQFKECSEAYEVLSDTPSGGGTISLGTGAFRASTISRTWMSADIFSMFDDIFGGASAAADAGDGTGRQPVRGDLIWRRGLN